MKQNISEFYRKYKVHIFVWLVYVLYESVISSMVFDRWVNPVIYLSHYAVFILFFYIHADYALPWVLKYRRWMYILLPLAVIVQGFAHMACQYMVSYLLRIFEVTKTDVNINLSSILMNIYRSITYLLFSTGYYFLRTYLKERRRSEDLEKQRLNAIISRQEIEQQLAQAQNAFLKAQINPHFLFNTLDFIFHEVNSHSEVAGEAVVSLADMMRFAINTDQTHGRIALADEIDQVQNLLYLQAITKNGRQSIQFDYAFAARKLEFIPLILLTLVENMIKHGNLNHPEIDPRISLSIMQNNFVIKTSNAVGNPVPGSNHSGLANIQKRLQHAYGETVEFRHEKVGNLFQVEIKVPISALT